MALIHGRWRSPSPMSPTLTPRVCSPKGETRFSKQIMRSQARAGAASRRIWPLRHGGDAAARHFDEDIGRARGRCWSILPTAPVRPNTKLSSKVRARKHRRAEDLIDRAVASDLDRREFAFDGIARNVRWVTSMDRHEPLQHCGEAHAGRLSFKCHTNLLSLRTAFGK